MTLKEFATQECLDDEFERLEKLNFKQLELTEAVQEKEREFNEAMAELMAFEKENKDELLI